MLKLKIRDKTLVKLQATRVALNSGLVIQARKDLAAGNHLTPMLQDAMDRYNESGAVLAEYVTALATPVDAALKAVNGKAEAHTITHYGAVLDVAERAEESLATLPEKMRVGATVLYVPAGPSANSYKYATITTTIELTRTSTGWWLTDIHKNSVWPKEPERFHVTITQEQADEIAKRAVSPFHVAA